jgi:hypothetical protein
MSLAERYARATLSGNLRNDALHNVTDVLAAMALSGGLSGRLVRVKFANDWSGYKRLLDHWTWIVSEKAVRRTWPDHIPVDTVAHLSLRHWLCSICPACTGLKRIKVLGAPVLAERDCPVCRGTGMVELRCEPRLRDYVLDMVEEVDGAFRNGMARASRKLSRRSETANDILERARAPTHETTFPK